MVYAIGDVHGRLDLLDILLGQVTADAAALPAGREAELILLGDYIDRGPQSAEVVGRVIDLQGKARPPVRALKGNHEAALVSFLADHRIGPAWSKYGGSETLRSYGVRAPLQQDDLDGWEAARRALDAALPPAHRDFYERLESYVVIGDYCFVHAGLRPGIAIADQDESDLIGIRHDFLGHKGSFEKKVVYGHTPTREPVVEPHRIGIDTGAYVTGVLTALKLWDASFELIQARAPSAASGGQPVAEA